MSEPNYTVRIPADATFEELCQALNALFVFLPVTQEVRDAALAAKPEMASWFEEQQ